MGATGSGKSTLIANLVLDDVRSAASNTTSLARSTVRSSRRRPFLPRLVRLTQHRGILNVHLAYGMRQFITRQDWLTVYQLPSYAPDLASGRCCGAAGCRTLPSPPPSSSSRRSGTG